MACPWLTGPAPPSPPKRADSRRKKSAGNNAAPLPRALDAERSRTKERMQRELGALGLDAGETAGAHESWGLGLVVPP